ncbi:MAG TPA: hypothetical protein VKV17_09180 [Bryobacteraceae bacterium]|nr:hypothetical protein [Bryobacteraceae bacterium]
MLVRIRLGRQPKPAVKRARNRRIALAIAALLSPGALAALVLAIWRLGADLNLTGSFAIPSGLFSHWQVWMGTAVVLQVCSLALNRYGRGTKSESSSPHRYRAAEQGKFPVKS